jgi:hypothetical protein
MIFFLLIMKRNNLFLLTCQPEKQEEYNIVYYILPILDKKNLKE